MASANKSSTNPMMQEALRYADLGLKVIPLRTEGDIKAPHQMTGQGPRGGHHAASSDREQIKEWWRRSPNSGIGINCRASGIVVVDVDLYKGGGETLKQLQVKFPGVLESMVVAKTGGGGLHIFFVAEEGKKYPGTFGHAIEVKHNGYVAVSPSPHPSGRTYEWADGKDLYDHDFLMPLLSAEKAHEMSLSMRGSTRAAKALVRARSDVIEHEADEDDPFADITDDRPLGLSSDQIRRIVFTVPNAGHTMSDPDEYRTEGARSYDDWFSVLCGIYHETGGSDEGRAIALEWSEQSPRHNDADFEKKWNSAGHEGKGVRPVTFRTVRKMSNDATAEEREAKYEDILRRFVEAETLDEVSAAAADAKQTALDDPLKREALVGQYRAAVKRVSSNTIITLAQARKDLRYLDPTITAVPEWCRVVCYISEEDVFFDYETAATTWTRSSFDNTFMREAMTEEDIRAGQSRPSHSPSDLALNRYNIPRVNRRGYIPWLKPSKDPFYESQGLRWINTYHSRFALKKPKGALTEEQQAAVDRFEQFLMLLIPDERERHLFMNWCRYVIDTRKRVGWSPVLLSVEGTGKTILLDFLRACVGHNNASVISGMALQDKFNSWAERKLLAIIEEVGGFNRRDRFDTLNAIKPLITNDYISIRRMRMEPFEVENTVNLIFTTNKPEAFDVGGGDSRLWFPTVTPGFRTEGDVKAWKAKHPHFYPLLLEALHAHGGALKAWLCSQPYLAEFQPGQRAPASQKKEELIDMMKGDERRLLEDIIADAPARDLCPTLLRVGALTNEMQERDPAMAVPYGRWLTRELTDLGFIGLGRVKVDGQYERFWTRTPEAFRGSMFQAKVRAWLDGGPEPVQADEDDDPL